MIKYTNGQYVEMTEEEIAEIRRVQTEFEQVQMPTAEERLAALESAMLDMLMGG